MGCGKTTVGRLLADRLERPFLDNDEQLERSTGMSARRIEEEYGTAELHRLERDVFDRSIEESEPSVITAAASVLDTVAAATVADHLVVHLRCAGPVSSARAATGRHRPTVRSGVRSTAESQARRNRRATELADVVIDADEATPTAIAERIVLVDLTALIRRAD